jgi:hypothetical protein
MTVRLQRVREWAASLPPEERARLLAKAGLIEAAEIEEVAAKLRASARRPR